MNAFFTLLLSALKQLLSFAEWETVDMFGVWRPEHTQMSKHGLNPAKNVRSFCNWNRYRVSARRGPSLCLPPEQVQLQKHFQTPARSIWNIVFTESGWKLIGSELLASSAIQERVNKLTVVLTKARLIANVMEFTWKVK